MSLTTSTQSPLPTLNFDTPQWDVNGPQIREYFVIPALACGLYGIFVLLCGASIYSLVQLNNRNWQTTLIPSLALFALFCSTTIYTVTIFIGRLENVLQQVILGSFALWPIENPVNVSSAPLFGPSSPGYEFIYCAPTAALTINILLGDAIVCWRACVIWQYNKIVMGMCVMLLLTTFALGTVDTTFSCLEISSSGYGSWKPDPHANGTGGLYQGFSYGVAATVLSLVTNMFATCAVMVRAWQSRRKLRQYFVTGPRASQVEKVFSLLVESGMIYCALWTVVLAWQAGTYDWGTIWAQGDNSFWDIFDVIINGALVHLIAIYPTVIIVLVALNRSHMESGFTRPSQDSVYALPLHPLTVAVNTTVSTRCDSQTPGMRSESVLVIGQEEYFVPRDFPEDFSTHTTEERKRVDTV
ncbi:hypothetical protein V8D89_014907 [Ganoderma adspersum]